MKIFFTVTVVTGGIKWVNYDPAHFFYFFIVCCICNKYKIDQYYIYILTILSNLTSNVI